MSVKQISVFLENKKGRLAELTDTLEREAINMRALSLADTADFGVLRIIVDDVERCLAVLKGAGFVAQVTEVIAIEVEDKPGGLHHILKVLDAAAINVEYLYAYVEKRKTAAVVICKVDDRGKAGEALKKAGITTVAADVLKTL
jgi:hypothetical protein